MHRLLKEANSMIWEGKKWNCRPATQNIEAIIFKNITVSYVIFT